MPSTARAIGLVPNASPGNENEMNEPQRRDLEEIMDFDPEEGIANLDQHLDRLNKDAGLLGYSFDRHAARNELQAATFGKRKAGKARLLVSPSGALAIELKSCGG